jgi:hypothetical protein
MRYGQRPIRVDDDHLIRADTHVGVVMGIAAGR